MVLFIQDWNGQWWVVTTCSGCTTGPQNHRKPYFHETCTHRWQPDSSCRLGSFGSERCKELCRKWHSSGGSSGFFCTKMASTSLSRLRYAYWYIYWQILCQSESMAVDYKFHADTRTLIDDRKALEVRLAGVANTVSQSRSINNPDLGKQCYGTW